MPVVLAQGSKIFVTGGNGYIGSWVLKLLLEQGYAVRAAVRSLEKAEPLKEYFSAYVGENGKLEFVVVDDFVKEGAFDEAVVGADGILHIAAPLASKGDDPDDFIKPIVNGTLNMLKSASRPESTVKRLIITSSTAAISRVAEPIAFDENDWSVDPQILEKEGRSAPMMVKYRASKTLAEKAAWKYYEENKGKIGWDLVVLNPPFVFGPPLIRSLPVGTSVDWWYRVVIKDEPKDAAALKASMPYVDVRDVAEAHVRSLTVPEAGGERIIVGADTMTWQEAIDHVNSLENIPPLKAPTTQGIKDLEKVPLYSYNSEKSRKVLGLKYIEYEDTVRDMLQELSERGF